MGERSALFGGTRFTIETVTIGNGAEVAGKLVIDESAPNTGMTVVEMEMVLENVTDGSLLWDQTPFLRLAGDPVEIGGTLTKYTAIGFDAGAGGRSTFAFELLLALSLLWSAWRTLATPRLDGAIVLFIVFGLLMSLAWARLAAPDIGLAEAAIGAGLTGALLLDAYGVLRRRRAEP